MRMCNGCSIMKPKQELIRVVKDKENVISVDYTGKKNGRGAYICFNTDCVLKAKKNKRIDRTLGLKIDETVYEEIENKTNEK
ncbi:MAG: RNase P modulator RnpM [Oscillospiraceae bacterium]